MGAVTATGAEIACRRRVSAGRGGRQCVRDAHNHALTAGAGGGGGGTQICPDRWHSGHASAARSGTARRQRPILAASSGDCNRRTRSGTEREKRTAIRGGRGWNGDRADRKQERRRLERESGETSSADG